MNLTAAMSLNRKAKMVHGKGEAWFYVSHEGIEVEVADEKGCASMHSVLITKSQLFRAVQIIREGVK